MTDAKTLVLREDRDGIALIAPPFSRRAPPGPSSRTCNNLVAGAHGRDALAAGDTDGGIWSAGMIQGLIHDIPTMKDLVDRIIAEAEGLIEQRLQGLVKGYARAGGWGRHHPTPSLSF